MADDTPVVLDCAKGIYPEKPAETERETFDREYLELHKALAQGVVSQSDILRVLSKAVSLLPPADVAAPAPVHPPVAPMGVPETAATDKPAAKAKSASKK